MKFAFIGMSGSGKTFWSKKFVSLGYTRYGCDELIGKKINATLGLTMNNGTKSISEWMGQPYDVQYEYTSKKYLEFEREVMNNIIQRMNTTTSKNIVIDSTGSLIYLDPVVLEKLKKRIFFVYLKPSDSYQKKMIQLYFDDPKPIIWGDIYTQKTTETDLESIYRCYPKLLKYRSEYYESLASMTITTDTLEHGDFTIYEFERIILSMLDDKSKTARLQ